MPDGHHLWVPFKGHSSGIVVVDNPHAFAELLLCQPCVGLAVVDHEQIRLPDFHSVVPRSLSFKVLDELVCVAFAHVVKPHSPRVDVRPRGDVEHRQVQVVSGDDQVAYLHFVRYSEDTSDNGESIYSESVNDPRGHRSCSAVQILLVHEHPLDNEEVRVFFVRKCAVDQLWKRLVHFELIDEPHHLFNFELVSHSVVIEMADAHTGVRYGFVQLQEVLNRLDYAV
mmetsp:Transcript_11120/g.12506  ORF Transcript_11120/g.12506 Transcript_11120/m.12506 type:complete len:226 (+) Transcript_11120:187-864(+)